MTSLNIGTLELNMQIERPRRRKEPYIEHVHLSIGTSSCQLWDDTECAEIFEYVAAKADGRRHYSRHVAELPRLDETFRFLAEQRALHRGDMIGAFLAPAVEAMELAIAERDGSSVYFADAGGQIKIGWSRKVGARLAQLQTGSAVPIKLLATTPGGLALERRLHKQFHHLRLSGEWFLAAPELLNHIAGLATAEATP